MEKEIELIIIGGGPAGVAAGVYAARKKLQTICITEDFGGQSVVSQDIRNWIGTPSISGVELATSLKKHLYEYESDEFKIVHDAVVAVSKKGSLFSVTTKKGATFLSKGLMIATGSRRKTLAVEGADTFEHKGLTYCASCDGPFFTGKDVIVVGGGNAGFETAAQLLAYTKSVTLLHRSDVYKADAITIRKVLSHKNMTGVLGATIQKVYGNTFVEGVVYKKNGEVIDVPVQGVFVEIGLLPSTGLFKDVVALDSIGRIIVNSKTQETSDKFIWAAGDCADGKFHQNNIASGDAVKAMEQAYITLKT